MKIKKARWLYLALAVVMLVSLFAGLTGADDVCPEPPDGAEDVILFAGQHINVGTVYVWNDDEYLYVQYLLDDDAWDDGEGWGLYETHVHVGMELGDFPLNRGGNPQVGHFAYKATHEGVKCYTEVIPLGDWEADDLLIAAHAVVKNITFGTDTPTLSWKRSTERTTEEENPVAYFSGYGAEWDLDDAFAIELDDEQVVWDNGLYQYRDGVTTPSWASWKYAYNWSGPDPNVDGGSYDGYSDLRRFQATFVIPEGDEVLSGKLISAGGFEGIPINDNVYIFLNEDLLFWGGTRVNQITDGEFMGMPGVQALRGEVEPKETDRWYIPGTLPEIADFTVGTNSLDVFAEENERWGGMGELVLEIEYQTTTKETAWADGTRFTERGNWATYFGYTVQEYLELVDEFTVDSGDPEGTNSSITLVDGEDYRIKVSGTWSNKPSNPHMVDAKYISFDDWATYLEGYPERDTTLLQLMVDEEFVDWGDYSADHVYYWSMEGADSTINLRVYDTYYGDNVGFFDVEIYRVW